MYQLAESLPSLQRVVICSTLTLIFLALSSVAITSISPTQLLIIENLCIEML